MRCSRVFCVRVNGRLKMRCPPRCSTLRLSTRSGARGRGGSGGPTLPQAASKKERQRERGTERKRDGEKERRRHGETERKRDGGRFVCLSLFLSISLSLRLSVIRILLRALQDVSTKVFILHDVGQHIAHVSCVNNLALLFQVGAFEGNLVEDFLQDRVQSARAYVLGGLVHLEGEVGYFVNRVFGDFERDAFGLHQRLVLFDQGVLRLGQNAFEVVDGQRLQFDADGEPALQFGDQV